MLETRCDGVRTLKEAKLLAACRPEAKGTKTITVVVMVITAV